MAWRALLVLLAVGPGFGKSSATAVRRRAADSPRERTQRRVTAAWGTVVGVAYRDPGTGDTLYREVARKLIADISRLVCAHAMWAPATSDWP